MTRLRKMMLAGRVCQGEDSLAFRRGNRLFFRGLRRHYVGKILLVRARHVFVQSLFRNKTHVPGVSPRFRENLRVVIGNLDVEMIKVGAGDPLRHMQRIAMKASGSLAGILTGAEPRFVVETDHIDDQRIPLPVSR